MISKIILSKKHSKQSKMNIKIAQPKIRNISFKLAQKFSFVTLKLILKILIRILSFNKKIQKKITKIKTMI
jgi:hypothetical protein